MFGPQKEPTSLPRLQAQWKQILIQTEEDKDMKTRQGFVSNSSTTSFCIMGVSVYGRDSVDQEELENIEGLRVESSYDHDCIWAGLYAQDLRNEETGAEFCARARALIKKAGLSGDVDWMEEAWRDG